VIKERAERAESELKSEQERWQTKENQWLGMFKDLYQLSKTGELAKMKATLEDTLSKQNSPYVTVP
jgi:hypothetical protein